MLLLKWIVCTSKAAIPSALLQQTTFQLSKADCDRGRICLFLEENIKNSTGHVQILGYLFRTCHHLVSSMATKCFIVLALNFIVICSQVTTNIHYLQIVNWQSQSCAYSGQLYSMRWAAQHH